jgi:5-hydroxyisourate hydrolase-like protein (transthyretin family)
MRKLLASAAAVTTLATAATGALALTAPANADTKAPTSLSIREARQMIVLGGHDRIGGQLIARGQGAIADATVQLLKKPKGAQDWTAVASQTTNEQGGVRFLVTPQQTSRFALVFAGDANHFATRSGVVTTRVVRRIPTAIGIRVDPHQVAPGGSADIRGRLHLARRTRHPRPLADQTLTLKQKNTDNSWTVIGTQQTNENGVVDFTVTPAATSRYALFFAGTERLRPSRSHGATVRVGQPTSLSVTTSATSIDPEQPVTIQGVLTDNGQPLAGQSVELRARPAHKRKANFATVATGTTATDGTVSFTQSPTADTVYRLRFRPTSTENGSVSPTATVLVRRATTLSIRADGDTVQGTLFGPRNNGLGNRTVTLQSSPAGADTWTDVTNAQTGPHGAVAFSVTPTTATDYRLAFAATSRYQACHSGVVTLGGS